MTLAVQILAIAVAVSMEFVLRTWVGLPFWTSAMMALGAYLFVLLGGSFTLWLRTEHRYQRLHIPYEDGGQGDGRD